MGMGNRSCNVPTKKDKNHSCDQREKLQKTPPSVPTQEIITLSITGCLFHITWPLQCAQMAILYISKKL